MAFAIIVFLFASADIKEREDDKKNEKTEEESGRVLEPDPDKDSIILTKDEKVENFISRGKKLKEDRLEYLDGVRIERERIAEEKRLEEVRAKEAEEEKIRLEVVERERIEKEKELEVAKQTKVEDRSNEKEKVSRGSTSGRELGEFQATAYDLSYASCQKNPGDKGYGITRSGVNLAGQSLESARAIAVDPNVIPLGSTVHIEFEEPYTHLSGNYKAVDTGGAIKGRIVDIFMGSGNVSSQVSQFGRRKVKITVLD